MIYNPESLPDTAAVAAVITRTARGGNLGLDDAVLREDGFAREVPNELCRMYAHCLVRDEVAARAQAKREKEHAPPDYISRD